MITAESGPAVDMNKEIIWRSDGNYVVDDFI